jgi:hypothetical protein
MEEVAMTAATRNRRNAQRRRRNRAQREAREHAAMVARILRCWEAATAADLADGLGWYARANDLAAALSAGAPISRAQAAGVIAALSPRNTWDSNVNGATAMVAAHAALEAEPTVAGTTDNRDKAWAILNHAGDPLDILGGPKVRSFYANIMGDLDAVTVDVWAARAAEGFDNPNAPTGNRYERIAAAYREAASAVGVAPRDMQAAVWVYIRRAVLSEARAA